MHIIRVIFSALAIFSSTGFSACSQAPPTEQKISGDEVERFISFFGPEATTSHEKNLKYLDQHWKDAYATMILEVIYLLRDPSIVTPLVAILEDKTGHNYGLDFDQWYQWLWQKDQQIIPDYGDFKAQLYKQIDPHFETYFAGRTQQAEIRLDEVRWGGVGQDGIPPLRQPEMIDASEAEYLDSEDIVFGIEVNGDIRAYPKRILAWHEMFVDEVGGIPVAGVYCTLCGTVILYQTEVNGTAYQIGTSGFLYRSNKLIYDQATQSLWNTLWGTPVVGPLVGKGIELPALSVVTTTWGEWSRRHPETKVLSLNTGHQRNYGEGVAYHQYFATDEIMFAVPFDDQRLKNKQEVLALKFPEFPKEQLAISTKYLSKHPIYNDSIGAVSFVVLTDESGANRVYETKGQKFKHYDRDQKLIDSQGQDWKLLEDRLVAVDGNSLNRLPYHRSFWFGWHAAYPNTRLVK